jgi:hypothetical protein
MPKTLAQELALQRTGASILEELASVKLNAEKLNRRKSPESLYETTSCEFWGADSLLCRVIVITRSPMYLRHGSFERATGAAKSTS